MKEEEFVLTWNNYSDHMKHMLEYLRTSQTLTDVTLVCDDKIMLEAHKIILVSCSKFFEAILHQLTQSSDYKPIIYLKGINYQEMECILQFMYLGEARFSQERSSEFLRVATELELKSLSQIDDDNHMPGDQAIEVISSEAQKVQSNKSEELKTIECDTSASMSQTLLENTVDYDKVCSENKLENSNESNCQLNQIKEDLASLDAQLKPIQLNKYTPKVPLDIRDEKDVRRAIENLDKLKSEKSNLKEETSFFCYLCALKYSNKDNLERHLKAKHTESLPIEYAHTAKTSSQKM